jgi:hypothetical protein
MEKTVLKAQIGDTEYTLEYTRDSVCRAEEAFGISMLIREEPKTYSETMTFLKALLYGALVKNHKDVNPKDMDAIYEKFVGDDGYDEDVLVEGLVDLLGKTLNPKGGGRKKKLLTVSK